MKRMPFDLGTISVLGIVGGALLTAALDARRVDASFHLMQIEQVIGGVNGDTSAQAIQLRMRAGGQSILSAASVRAVDASGANEVLLDNTDRNLAGSSLGDRVLITTPNFDKYTDVALVSDFTMAPLPASYLAAGQITFENSSGSTTYWSLSWGGAGFTGSTTGSATNDLDGDFGPPIEIALPSDSLQALLFQGTANARSSTNLADYALTAGAAVFTNNAGNSFTLTQPAVDSADFNENGIVDGADFVLWQRHAGGSGGLAEGDANNSGNVDGDDLAIWRSQYGSSGGNAAATAVPEPHSALLACLCSGAIACRRKGLR